MRDWMDVAVLAKTRNLKGRLVVQSAAGLPFLLREGVEVAFVPPQTDMPRSSTVTYVGMVDGHCAEMEFEGVDGEAAQGLVGCHCLMRRSDIDESLFEDEPTMWENWQVFDQEGGLLGEVASIAENPGQALLEITRADGRGELLVPVVDEFICDVDVDAQAIYVALPDGLLDLNVPNGI